MHIKLVLVRVSFLAILLFVGSIALSQTTNAKLNSLLGQVKPDWQRYPSDHFNFFVEKGRFAEQHIEFLKDSFETTRAQVLKFLGVFDFVDTAQVIIVDAKDRIKSLLGFEAQGFAIPEHNIAIFLGSGEYNIVAGHESTHYYAHKVWGKPFDNWLSEGLAVHFDRKWNNHQVDTLAKHLKDNQRLYKMTAIQKNFYSLNFMIAYPQLGSFTSFLLSAYGLLKFKKLWTTGFANIQSVYGKNLKVLEKGWLLYLDVFLDKSIDYSRHIK